MTSLFKSLTIIHIYTVNTQYYSICLVFPYLKGMGWLHPHLLTKKTIHRRVFIVYDRACNIFKYDACIFFLWKGWCLDTEQCCEGSWDHHAYSNPLLDMAALNRRRACSTQGWFVFHVFFSSPSSFKHLQHILIRALPGIYSRVAGGSTSPRYHHHHHHSWVESRKSKKPSDCQQHRLLDSIFIPHHLSKMCYCEHSFLSSDFTTRNMTYHI